MKPSEKPSPLGPYRRKREESPFGPKPQRRRPRDPFAAPGSDPGRPTKLKARPRPIERPLELFVEVAPGGAAFVHVPSLPGLCFRAGDPEQAVRIARDKIIDYARWLLDEKLADLNPLTSAVTRLVRAGFGAEIEVVEREQLDGAPVWITGNAAAFFSSDDDSLTDEQVRAHFNFMRRVVRRMRVMIAGLAPAQRAWKPAPDRRSLDETLDHIADLMAWFCSRLDDDHPAPGNRLEETPIERIGRMVDEAEAFLLAVPLSARAEVHIPARLPSTDANERWTHTKVCRRQAEHLWEHLQGLSRAVRMAADA